MLTIMDRVNARNCQGVCRREFLKVGALGFGGLALPQLLASRANASSDNIFKDRSVVFLFLHGGPAHIEFFDPKMTAPAEFRSITGEVQTATPGVTFGGTFPRLARMTDKFSLLRSYGSGNSGHTYNLVASGGNSLKAAMGSLYAKVRGNNHPLTGMPSNIVVFPEAIQEELKLGRNFETGALPTLTSPGDLGPSFGAFDPSGGGQLKQNMELRISPDRLGDRRSLLTGLDNIRRQIDATGLLEGADRFQTQAFDVITRGVAEAFDLSRERPETLEMYDTSKLFDMRDLQRYGDMRRVSNLLGHQMLLARRLCEAGCGYVTVSDCGWDMHANNNSPKGMTGIWPMGHQVDHAVSAFIEDVHQRGLSDKILLVVTGEMGRTPRINNNGGRDHYGTLTPLLFSGGGLNMGQVIGQSDSQAAKPATESYGPHDMLATIMHSLFDIGQLRIDRSVPRDVERAITSGEPIPGLV